MADVVAIRAAIAAQVAAAAVPALTTYAEYQAVLNILPAFLVLPTRPIAKYDVCLGAGILDGSGNPMSPTDFTFRGILPVSKADTISNVQDYLDPWCGYQNTASTVSIAMALDLNPTLGGLVEWCNTTVVDSYGPIEWAGVEYFGASFIFEVSAR
jgi:hypothetical protein